MPRVDITVDQEKWYGQHGVLNNRRRAYGRAWELPARLKITGSDESTVEQAVGLRFHGGVSARTLDYAKSYRVYARNEYGRSHIPARELLGHDRDLDFKTVVFKNVFHTNFPDVQQDFNPFNHALALDIADQIGALVPSHFLVDLFVNGEAQGIHLGLEHLSEKTVRNWLGRDDISVFTYKDENSERSRYYLDHVVASIRGAVGEQALEQMNRFFDLDNVMTTAILASYTANFDFCQGVEIFDHLEEGPDNVKVTSINWDLDWAFLYISKGVVQIKGEHVGFPLIDPTYKGKFHDCPRTRMFSWVYQESPTFRKLFRDKLEELLEKELSPENVNRLLDHYAIVNDSHYSGSRSAAVSDLRQYAQTKPGNLLKQLAELERKLP